LVVLNADQQVDLSDALPIASAVPLDGAAMSHDAHGALAVAESASIDSHPGSGATIFLLMRRWTPPGVTVEPGPASLCELSVHTPDGATVFDLSHAGSAGPPSWDPAAGTTVEVDPGSFLLRWSDRSGIAAEQCLNVPAGWQTQVFLVEQAHDGETPAAHNVSVLMSRQTFDPGDQAVQLVEETRAALAEERKVATAEISDSLFAKFENPMLGLFGAHLMLIAKQAVEQRTKAPTAPNRPQAEVEFDQALFDQVVSNLAPMLGERDPDVLALSTRTSGYEPGSLPPLAGPPMLWKSWQLLVEASNDAPSLVPVAVWEQTLGTLPLRPFLVWSPAADRPAQAMEWKAQTSRALGEAPAGAEGVKRRFSRELLAPRGVIDEVADGMQV
jgi:hypothetical protein